MTKKKDENLGNVLSLLFHKQKTLKEVLNNDELRYSLQFLAVYAIFTVVSAVMTILNISTSFHMLMWSTLIFAVANFLNLGLATAGKIPEKISRWLFAIEALALFTFFGIVGEPEGFSILWALLVPTGGILLYGAFKGSMFAAAEWTILVFLFWTPWGRNLLQWQYSDPFMMRFPILYLAFYAIGMFFELIRSFANAELSKTKAQFEYMSNHDALTGLRNRYGFNSAIEDAVKNHAGEGFAFAIMDLDHFKNINDEFGHLNGDLVLQQHAKEIEQIVGENGLVCRWGGEEFALIIQDVNKAESLCHMILDKRRISEFELNGVKKNVTVSIGLALVKPGQKVVESEVVSLADTILYEAKQNGRDQLKVTEYHHK